MRKLIESYNNGYGPGNGGNGNGAPGSGNNGGNGNNGNGGNGNRPPRRPSILMMILSGLMTVIAILMLYNAFFGTGNGTEVSYTDFLKDLEADKVEAVEVNKESGQNIPRKYPPDAPAIRAFASISPEILVSQPTMMVGLCSFSLVST